MGLQTGSRPPLGRSSGCCITFNPELHLLRYGIRSAQQISTSAARVTRWRCTQQWPECQKQAVVKGALGTRQMEVSANHTKADSDINKTKIIPTAKK
jgi:hypothetical protein